MTQTPFSASIFLNLVLTGCTLGFQTYDPIDDSGLNIEPSSEPNSANLDTDSDTDSTETNDTDSTDTETPADIDLLIASMTPLYGTTAGGDTISIVGGPFANDATVSFGGNPGTVVSNNGSLIRVNTPSASVDGPVEVRVEMNDGYGIADDAYVYFEDGLGKTSTIGVIGKVEYIGQYWNGGVTPDPTAHMWTAFTSPVNIHFWQLSTPALNTCARNGIDSNGDGVNDDINGDGVVDGGDFYQFNGDLTVVDVGADSLTMTATSAISLSRASNDPNSVNYYIYKYAGDLPPSMVQDDAFYDLSVFGGNLDSMTVAQYARASKSSSLISPNLNTATIQAVNRTQEFSWTPSGADWIEIRMFQANSNSYIVSDVICNVDDSGSFTFQNIHQAWTPSETVYVQFTRVYESTASMPHNDGISRVIGAHTIFGAGSMN